MEPTTDTLTEIDLDFLEEERRLYTADSLNNLHKMNMCSDIKDLTAQPLSSPTTTSPAEKRGEGSSTRDDHRKPGCLSSVLCGANNGAPGGDRGEGSSKTSPPPASRPSPPRCRPRLFLVLLFLSAAVLMSLAMSAYAVYLMVETASRLDELVDGQADTSYLEEVRQWKSQLQQYLDHSQGQSRGQSS